MVTRIHCANPRLLKILSALVVFFFWICSAGSGSVAAKNYGAECNPTGNPIGGGTGYGKIIDPDSATYPVTDKAGLLAALKKAKSGEIVYIDDDAEIDITDLASVQIRAGVTIASGRGRNGSEGALLYATGYGGTTYPFWIAPGTKMARITGLRFFGSDMEIGDQEGPYNWNRGFHCGSAQLEVDNCELAGWGCAAVEVAPGGYVYLHHNYIHHNRRNGLGYGITIGGTDASKPNSALIEANLFDAGRHFIAAHGTAGSSYIARYNICLEHQFSHAFDMHGGADRNDGTDIAGDSVTICNNSFRDIDETGVCVRGKPQYMSPINNNWFYHASQNANPAPVVQKNATGNLNVSDNAYGTTPPSGTKLPVAVPKANCTSGTAPLTVKFDGSSSNAPSSSILDYLWFLGDGKSAVGSTVKGKSPSYTFKDPGTYNVLLQVRNKKGVPASCILPITVYPGGSGCMLSFWVKDSYRGSVSNAYVQEVLIDDKVVWSSDVAGDDGWEHVVKDVSAQVSGKSSVKLTLRTRCTTARNNAAAIKMLHTYWDDVVLFGYTTENGGFESASSGAWAFSKTGKWYGGRTTSEMRSGHASYDVSYLSNTCAANASGQITQTLNKVAPKVTSYLPQGTKVAVNTTIKMTFSEPMDKNSVKSAFSVSPSVSGSISWSGNTMTFKPSSSLKTSKTYTVTLTTKAKNLSGQSIASNFSWKFTTKASSKKTLGRIEEGAAVSGIVPVEADIDDETTVAKVEYYLDDVLRETITASPFIWNWNADSAPTGPHAVRVDVTGNDGTVSRETITVDVVRTGKEEVYPNPYIKGKSAGGPRITIANLPASCTVRIYTIAGDPVATLHHDQTEPGGREEWDITDVPGGIYLYSITGKAVPTRNGKIGIVK